MGAKDLKVLQINSVCGFGSTGRIATDLYSILEENGHECLIAYGRENAPKGINSYRIGTNFAIKIKALLRRNFKSLIAHNQCLQYLNCSRYECK